MNESIALRINSLWLFEHRIHRKGKKVLSYKEDIRGHFRNRDWIDPFFKRKQLNDEGIDFIEQCQHLALF